MLDPVSMTVEERRQLHRRALILSLGLWAAIMGLLWYTGTQSNFEVAPPLELWGLRAIWMVSGFAMGWIIFVLVEKTSRHSPINPFVPLIGLVLVFGAAHTFANSMIFQLATGFAASWSAHLGAIVYWLHFQLAWGILIFALVTGARAKSEREARSNAQRSAQEEQMRALKFQVHPHFLFNTLGAVSALLGEQRHAKAEEMIRKLAAYLRSGLGREPLSDVALRDEISDLENYLSIEQSRFDGRFECTIRIDPKVADASIPAFLLQPLLENSVKYAVGRSLTPVDIVLEARPDGSDVSIVVADNGPGAGSQGGLGTGEGNVRNRLATRFGDAIAFDSGTRFDPQGKTAGYRVSLRFPYEPFQEAAE